MYPIHDTDAQLLLATLIAAKRRPAALADIVAAAEFMGFPVAAPAAWATAFERFVTHGLLTAVGEGYALTPAAVQLVEGLPKKAEADERVFLVRERLAAYKPATERTAGRQEPADAQAQARRRGRTQASVREPARRRSLRQHPAASVMA